MSAQHHTSKEWDARYAQHDCRASAIIVLRDQCLRDQSVFTGFLQLVYAADRVSTFTGKPITVGMGIWSPHIEHAFVFPSSAQAHRWLRRLMADQDGRIRAKFWYLQQVVRYDGDFHPGLTVHRSLDSPRLYLADAERDETLRTP